MFSGLRLTLLGLLVWIPFAAGAVPDELAAQLTRQMHVNQQRYGIASQAVEVVRNGRVVFRGASGQVDIDGSARATSDHIFPAYSVSKLFVSTLVMQLVEQGKVDLDSPASAYLPDLPPRWNTITVRQLLNHSSGLPEYFEEAQMAGTAEANASFQRSLHAVYAALADKPLLFASGADTRYTQTNYLVLTQLLEVRHGKPYADIVAERIIGKLGLRHTFLGRDKVLRQRVVTAYLGNNGEFEKQPDVAWPAYALGHASLYSSAGDLSTLLQAVAGGKFVKKSTLQQLWQPQILSNGQRGWFATGWEVGESGAYRMVGHDGGARVRVRILFKDSLAGDVYTLVYLTSGSRRNVWTRTLLDSLMATVAPDQFRNEALSEKLIGFALQSPDDKTTQTFAETLRNDAGFDQKYLEQAVNTSGYAIRSNLGVDAALHVFTLNTVLFPESANTWDSLAEAYEAKGDKDKAKALRLKMNTGRDASP